MTLAEHDRLLARCRREAAGTTIAWELKSVNGKTIETRLTLPQGLRAPRTGGAPGHPEALFARQHPGDADHRPRAGCCTASQPVVNEAFLKDIAGLAKRLQKQFGLAPAQRRRSSGAARRARRPRDDRDRRGPRRAWTRVALLLLETALVGLEAARRSEGEALRHPAARPHRRDRGADVPRRGRSVARAGDDPGAAGRAGAPADRTPRRRSTRGACHRKPPSSPPRPISARRSTGCARISLPAARCWRRAAPIGRKLDFLAQEFNRESNTLCSKSNAGTVTAIGLELKAVVDQFREQVQNLE